MNDNVFKLLLIFVAIIFSLIFCVVVMPPLIDNPDVLAALAAGFVNPYASGYSFDVILCWAALAIWVIYEAKVLSVRFGWACLLLGLFPGVAVGMSLYLILRMGQIHQTSKNA